jgi:hypothetical protein
MNKMKKRMSVALLAFSVFSLSSCALILNGRYQQLKFTCTRDAEIKLNMSKVGRTNEFLMIPRKDLDGLIRISAPGCETKEMMLPLRPSWGTWLDLPMIFIPYVGLLPAYIDYAWDLDQSTKEVIDVELNCK